METEIKMTGLTPTPEEISRWIRDAILHSIHIEYYLSRLQIGRSDIQRPHDLVGHGNKLEWPCIRGFTMQYRDIDPMVRSGYILNALNHHRMQHHHQAWNHYNPTASTDAMRLGAVDAVCSLLEPRGYQGGAHTFCEIHDIAENNPIHTVAWMQLMAKEMDKIQKLNFECFGNERMSFGWLRSFERTAVVSRETMQHIGHRLEDTLHMLRDEHDIELPK